LNYCSITWKGIHVTCHRAQARAYHRILRVARTIDDLESSDDLNIDHLSEAIGYRNLEKH